MSKHLKINNPEYILEYGNIHPVNNTKNFILKYLNSIGFEIIEGPEIESEKFNFDMLNIKKDHPARQMHDTFYVQNKKKLLRTHTSPVQIRSMLNNTAPIAVVSGGKVYRKDDDSTHLPMFHQIEGMYIDENVSFSNLKDLIYKIIQNIFEEKVELRFRPSYFPFTEPSAEVDIMSSNGKWLEILGCGIVNPIVLENCDIDTSQYSGLAFGLGIERIAMLKHELTDIRELYKSNLDFLKQFK